MDVLVFMLFIVFMLIMLPMLFSIESEDGGDKSIPTYTGRPRTCVQHSWIHNDERHLYCSRCGRKPGEMQ